MAVINCNFSCFLFEAWPLLKNEIKKIYIWKYRFNYFKTPTWFKTAWLTLHQTLPVNLVSLFLFTCGFRACQIAYSMLLILSSESMHWTLPHRNLYSRDICENILKLKILLRMKQHYLVEARNMTRAFTVKSLNRVA